MSKIPKTTHELIFIGVLTTILAILKISGTIDISWIWVFSPIWILLILGLFMLLVILFLIKQQ